MKADTASDFLWTSRDGRRYRVEEMALSHLFNTVRSLLANHLPLPVLPGLKRWTFLHPLPFLQLAVTRMLQELKRRKELGEELEEVQEDQLAILLSHPSPLLPSTLPG
jgi:hypothetical protein